MIVVYEAHFINQSGRHFRPELSTAVRYLGYLIKLMPQCVPYVLMLATMLKCDIGLIIKLMGDMEPQALDSSLDRRTITFKAFVSGRRSATPKKSEREHFMQSPTDIVHQLKNKSSRRFTLGQGVARGKQDQVQKTLPAISDAAVCTDGVMMKVTTMDNIKLYKELEGKGTTVIQESSH